METTTGKLQITLTGSHIGCNPRQRGTLAALGLPKIGRIVVKDDTPSIRGMIGAISHLVSVTEVE